VCGGGWLHVRVLCGWMDRWRVSAVHEEASGDHEVNQSRCCRAPIVVEEEETGTCRIWCKNGIGGFHKNIANFWGPKLPDFLLAQKMRLKKCSSLVQ